jgi:hypothetical protein
MRGPWASEVDRVSMRLNKAAMHVTCRAMNVAEVAGRRSQVMPVDGMSSALYRGYPLAVSSFGGVGHRPTMNRAVGIAHAQGPFASPHHVKLPFVVHLPSSRHLFSFPVISRENFSAFLILTDNANERLKRTE